ncbi:bifunctional phosphoribosylaminoimidazolecarboxamide formyltransferase/IMP cyclohydrolase [Candidatus Poriferisocius sp.]|uniref:bifunctional phosphoribosylaminoimidazolecarboxamide formyltransferase/IMP cyclohydrolase n=1 Tax=Candidatus Poriferisocius sp. TaxID=3101276 RepID=UPI003B01ABEE
MSSSKSAGKDIGTPRALVSVYDKTGVIELAQRLVALGWSIISSGGTAAALAGARIPVIPVERITGAPEMLGGRVKTIHPLIHGALLADTTDPSHVNDLVERGIVPIDLVVCNLYPFSSDPSVELIDIGGPAMVRAAAKNHQRVGVVVRPADYPDVLDELEADGGLSDPTRRQLARAAFAHTAEYDTAIAGWLGSPDGPAPDSEATSAPDSEATSAPAPDPAPEAGDRLPSNVALTLERREVLRYGENPHQQGARYRIAGRPSWWEQTDQLQGKAMSYLNVFDADAAWRLVHDLGDHPAAAVIKHANPCGVAIADEIADAYRRAHQCDPVSAFGGIVAVNRRVTVEMVEAMADVFTEVLIAPDYQEAALVLLGRKKNLRVLRAPRPESGDLEIRTAGGTALVQTPDTVTMDRSAWRVVTERSPTDDQWNDLELAWPVAARVGSNCIVLVKNRQAVGIGAGQQNRRDAGRIAAQKAAGRAGGGACASDAFFPFRDGLDAAAEAGCAAVIQPGGSVRDQEVIDAANEHDMAMVFTGERHFRH